MPKPTRSDVYVDPVLTGLSVAYQNPAFVGEIIFPQLLVKKRSGWYYKYDKSKFRKEKDERGPSVRAARVGYGLSKVAYGPLVEHSLEQDIPYEIIDEADIPLGPRADATENVTQRILLGLEIRAAAILNGLTAHTPANKWSAAGSDPIGDIDTGQKAIQGAALNPANTLLLGFDAYIALKNHADIIDRIKYSERGVLTPELLAELFQVERVIVAKAMQNLGKEGKADNLAYIFGKHAWLIYIAPKPGIRKASFGYTLRLNTPHGKRITDRWDEPAVKAEFVRTSDTYEIKKIAAEAAYYFKNCVT